MCVMVVGVLVVSAGLSAGVADDEAEGRTALVGLLAELDDAEAQRDILQGMLAALRGRRDVAAPANWGKTYAALGRSPSAEVRELTQTLALIFHDPAAIQAVRRMMTNRQADAAERLRALAALVDHRAAGIAPDLQKLLDDPALRGAALRGLAAYGDDATPAEILRRYAKYTESERQDAVQTLASRPAYAAALLAAMESQQVPTRDLSAFTARQIQDLNRPELTARLTRVWGELKPTAARKVELIADYRRRLGDAAAADARRGRQVFQRTCATCHRMYEAGGSIGPDLTGSNRANLDYLLENLLDPSAVIGRDYQLTTVVTTDGRTLSGVIREKRDKTLVVQTVNERVVVQTADIEETIPLKVSMMPEGMLDKFSDDELRDLVAYLATKAQVESEQ